MMESDEESLENSESNSDNADNGLNDIPEVAFGVLRLVFNTSGMEDLGDDSDLDSDEESEENTNHFNIDKAFALVKYDNSVLKVNFDSNLKLPKPNYSNCHLKL